MSIFYLDYENGSDAASGADWANAWKTFGLGATAARIAPGDVIRVAKSPAPTSIGNATWNNLSKTVTLATAQTLAVDQCETAWTASANVTAAISSSTRKQGSYEASLAIAAGFTTGKVAYKATGTLDLSAYQKLTFWFRNNAAISAGNILKICLCSDTAGATPVDTFFIPAVPSTGRYMPLTITKDGGGNLGSAIQSIAVYADSDPGTITILLDNITACTTSGLNLQSLISKNTTEQSTTSSTGYANEGWYGIQSIVGTTILLDNETNTVASVGNGYFGTTETVTTYKRETIKTDLATTTSTEINRVMDTGASATYIYFEGGYDTGTNTQIGETFFDGLNGYGYGIYVGNIYYTSLNYFSLYRYNTGIFMTGGARRNVIENISNANNNTAYGISFHSTAYRNIVKNLINANNNNTGGLRIGASAYFTRVLSITRTNNNLNYGVYFNSNDNTIENITSSSNNATGVYIQDASGNLFRSLTTSSNSTQALYNNSGKNYFTNTTTSEATVAGGLGATSFAFPKTFVSKNPDDYKIYSTEATVSSQTTTRHTASGLAWQVNLTSTSNIYTSEEPFNFSLAKIAVTANNLVTVKVWVYKDSASGISARLVCKGRQIAGVDTDVVATAANVLQTWEELTITFTPTVAGVVEIEAEVYNTASSSVYYDDMTITQA